MSKKKCILVTGGAGFIGSALSRDLVSSGMPVVAVDSLLQQVHPLGARPDGLDRNVELMVSDVRDPETWASFLSNFTPEIVIHLAAETGTAQSLTESSRHATVNVVGTTMMLDAFVHAKILPGNIVLTSSRAIYGEGMWRTEEQSLFYPKPRSHAMLEAAQWDPVSPSGGVAHPIAQRAGFVMPNPTSIYGATKLAQEHVLSSWCLAFGVPMTILRLQNVYGKGQSPSNPYTGIINIFHRVARKGEAIEVYEDGKIDRDFVYITDVAAAILSAIRKPEDGVRIIDVGTGNATTIMEAAKIIARLHNAPAPVICGKFRDGDVRSAFADIEALRERLHVIPKISFEEGAKLVGDWLVESGHI